MHDMTSNAWYGWISFSIPNFQRHAAALHTLYAAHAARCAADAVALRETLQG